MDINKLVDQYIQLRDKKAIIKAGYDAKVKNIEMALDKVEAVLLKHFESTGAESVKTSSGTAYKSTRTSVTVADWDSFLSYVRDEEAWELLEHRAAKKQVEEFKSANEALPPGLNYSAEVVINVRRS